MSSKCSLALRQRRGVNVQAWIRRWLRAEIALSITAAAVGLLLLARPSGLYPWAKARACDCNHRLDGRDALPAPAVRLSLRRRNRGSKQSENLQK